MHAANAQPASIRARAYALLGLDTSDTSEIASDIVCSNRDAAVDCDDCRDNALDVAIQIDGGCRGEVWEAVRALWDGGVK